jgi:hypothetical protein
MPRFLHPLLLLLALSTLECGNSFCVPSSVSSSVDDIDIHPTNRRDFLLSSSFTLGTITLIGSPKPANAAYGDSSNLELPNYIEFLIEKNTVADPDSVLYKGPDPKIQLKRLLEASKRLEDIPPLAADKKWSQVQGILTGPLGTLAQTLNAISKDSTPEVQAKAKKVKETIFSINTAASKKNEAEVVSKAKQAESELEAFVRAAF